jgi:hypothetical protein
MQKYIIEKYKIAFIFGRQYYHPVSYDYYNADCRTSLVILAALIVVLL